MEFTKIEKAYERIGKKVKKTPLIPLKTIGQDAYIKMESLQITGSFKIRGALNKILSLSKEELEKGVIACSAGNHAQGVAMSAREQGIKSTICIPSIAPISKIEATKALGAEVVLVPTTFDDAKKRAYELAKENGYTFIHPFDDEEVIAGQGTIAIEILEQLSDVDIIVVPIGGGGLISGVALAAKTLKPEIQIIGVEAATAASMNESIRLGKIIELTSASSMADGIAVKRPGELTYAITKQYVDKIVLVSESEISGAVLALMEQEKIVAEGAGATSVAALMYNKFDCKDKKVVCLLSGGNIDMTRISKVIEKGLYKTKRTMEIIINLNDYPGEMNKLTKLFDDIGANIVGINQEVDLFGDFIDTMRVRVKLATRDLTHQDEIKLALSSAGYEFS
ncbi:threonine ammonia-lyase [Peptoniphilus sp. GNH]|nr:threonine ammonia-lyase [Clostridiales bacterium KA00134]UHR02238.1 threonine ammonia-lyase [Peptoniphilus sp. GNH]